MRLCLLAASTLALAATGCATSPRADTGPAPTPARAPDTTASVPADTTPRDTVGDTASTDRAAVSQVLPDDANAPRRLLSPRDSVQTTIGGAMVSVNYGRPSMRGRTIFGGLVPYGKVWRTGANEATALVTTADLEIGGVTVPAGQYTLYTIPTPTLGDEAAGGGSNETWQLIINKQTGQWGTEYDQAQDLARIPMRLSTLADPVEQFTIEITPAGEDAGTLALLWDTTSASVDFKVKR